MNKLDSLKSLTTVVADTGDFESIILYKPQDATTNPSLILAACNKPQYKHLIDDAVNFAKTHAETKEGSLTLAMDKLSVNFGVEILKTVPGRVSTEVPARLSFDTRGSIHKAKYLIHLYEKAGFPKERVLIKLASTWEGIEACKELEKEGIHCNMTLMFSLAQAVCSAEAKATLISPFVGRILDWYKKAEGVQGYPKEKDPGVVSVKEIFNYLKKFDYKTQVMGASFRNSDEILELAGADLLTISPDFLKELQETTGVVERKLSVKEAKASSLEKMDLNESEFRWALNQSPMATEKLAEGIRKFAEDTKKLEDYIMKTYHF
jgi:transaldolase